MADSSTPDQFQDAPEDSEASFIPSLLISSTRPDGKGYIDDPSTDDRQDDELALSTGSSVEEELDSNPPGSSKGWGTDGDEDTEETAVIPEGMLEESDEEYDNLDWGVEDEDWELADGDFTKQYNRVRQQYSATQVGDQATSGPSRPLPARNPHVLRSRKAGPSAAATKAIVNPSLVALGGVAANPKSAQERLNQKDKADRATHEQVLDARTRLVLSALVNRGYFAVIDGCVSTGKEANVYLAFPGETPPAEPKPYPEALAVKIYRTSILNFRSRQSYIVGEHRFRGGYASARNPRKMVRLWAEKELRNLRRLSQGGVRSPVVIEQRENVLVMEFLGSGNIASPRLKDAEISKTKLPRLYGELLVAMRRMYHHCKLVHADLSEYNILYHASHLYIIDVSQSVEHDHPSAFDFLRSDIRNMEDYFVRRSGGEVRTLGVRRSWSFIVDEFVGGLSREDELGDVGEEKLFDVLRTWLDESPSTTENTSVGQDDSGEVTRKAEMAAAEAADDAVFMSSYIPRNLAEVYDPERDVDLLRSGQGSKLIYAGITGLNINDEGDSNEPGIIHSNTNANVDSVADNVSDDSDDSEDDDDALERKPRGFRHEDRDAKRDRKKALKEEAREKRKKKMPKSEKQRLIKKASGK